MKFVVCITRAGFGEFSTADLTLGRLYEVLDGPDAHGMLRLRDDSGEDYLYPAALFRPVEVAAQTAQQLHDVLAPV